MKKTKKRNNHFINVATILKGKKCPFDLPNNPSHSFNHDDYLYLIELNSVIEKIQSITSNPRTHLIAYKESKNIESVVRLDNNDLRVTAQRGKYWKEKDNRVLPEKVYSDVFDTDLAIYENRFIVKLINKLFLLVNTELRNLTSHIDCVSNNYQLHDAYNTSANDISKLSNISAPSYGVKKSTTKKSFLTIEQPELVETVKRLLTIRQHLTHIIAGKFYKTVKQAKPLSDLDIHPTNILVGDSTYAPCYAFYLKLNKMTAAKKNQVRVNNLNYFNFVAYRIIRDFRKLKYTFISRKIKVIKGQIKLTNFKLKNNRAVVTINSNKMHIDLLFKLSLQNKAIKKVEDIQYKITNKVSIDLMPNITTSLSNVLIEDQINKRLNSGYNNAFIITSKSVSSNNDVIICSPYATKIDSNITTMLKSMTLITEGDEFVYTRICPVCGNAFIGPEDKGLYICPVCGSSYSLVPLKTKKSTINLIWVKRIRSK